MRISGGEARGIPLTVPKGDLVRPATDGMRQAVFSSLAARVPGAWFADLFAGSGAYGLEALSRGATGGTFVERNAKAVSCIQKNVTAVCKSLGRDPRDLAIVTGDALAWQPLEMTPRPDIVFVDPPYEIITEISSRLFARLTTFLADKTDPVVVFEMPGETTLDPTGWTCVRRLGRGARQPSVAFFKRA
jgi:16S rRNA (guanine966-N2)-methyltransferase